MSWRPLKLKRCIKCNTPLEKTDYGYRCPVLVCGFRISKAKFESVLRSLYGGA